MASPLALKVRIKRVIKGHLPSVQSTFLMAAVMAESPQERVDGLRAIDRINSVDLSGLYNYKKHCYT